MQAMTLRIDRSTLFSDVLKSSDEFFSFGETERVANTTPATYTVSGYFRGLSHESCGTP